MIDLSAISVRIKVQEILQCIPTGKFLWPGFGENIRVIDWMCRRINGEDITEPSAVGLLPKKGSIDLDGLDTVNWDEMLSLPKDYWTEDIRETTQFLNDQVGSDLPEAIVRQLELQQDRISQL